MANVTQTTIIQGEDRAVEFQLLEEADCTGVQNALDLTGATEISVKTSAAISGNTVEFLLSATEITVVDAIHGKIEVAMSDTKTELMKVGTLNVEITVDIGTDRRIFQGLEALIIKKKLF